MRDRLVILDAPQTSLRLFVCTVPVAAREAAERHRLAAGSAAVLGQALAGALLLSSSLRSRIDVQIECRGPLKGLLVDAEFRGQVRGLVRVNTLGAKASAGLGRFDARPLLSAEHDDGAGMISILRAWEGMTSPHRAQFPFAGADLGAALTSFLRNDRVAGGELAVEVLQREGEPLAAVAGALLLPSDEDGADQVRALGEPLRRAELHAAMLRAHGNGADALAHELSQSLAFGPLNLLAEVSPRFACRCSRERVVAALRTLGAAELRDMAAKDGGAQCTCDFCTAEYTLSAAELLALAGDQPV